MVWMYNKVDQVGPMQKVSQNFLIKLDISTQPKKKKVGYFKGILDWLRWPLISSYMINFFSYFEKIFLKFDYVGPAYPANDEVDNFFYQLFYTHSSCNTPSVGGIGYHPLF